MDKMLYKENTDMEKVRDIISENFDNYKTIVIEEFSPAAIFDNAYEIGAKTEIYNFIMDIDLDDEQYKTLLSVASQEEMELLQPLFEYFLKKEYASCDSYGAIKEWIEWFCEVEKDRVTEGRNK